MQYIAPTIVLLIDVCIFNPYIWMSHRAQLLLIEAYILLLWRYLQAAGLGVDKIRCKTAMEGSFSEVEHGCSPERALSVGT